MKYVKRAIFAILSIFHVISVVVFADPHEQSPAGGGWLELDPKLPLLQSESSWFPGIHGSLMLEAWIYIDEPPRPQTAFSVVGQTDRFNWAIIGSSKDRNIDRAREVQGAILTQESGMVSASLPMKRWIHYVAIIDGGVAVGCDGFITGWGSGNPIVSVKNPLILGGIPILKESWFPRKEKTLPASGIYIDELRISSIVRYKGDYTVPTKAFTPDANTLGLYHFDEESESPKHYEDASKYGISLVRGDKNTIYQYNQ